MAESTYSMEDARPVFYIGEHETKRPLPVTTELVQHAHDLGVSPAFFFPLLIQDRSIDLIQSKSTYHCASSSSLCEMNMTN